MLVWKGALSISLLLSIPRLVPRSSVEEMLKGTMATLWDSRRISQKRSLPGSWPFLREDISERIGKQQVDVPLPHFMNEIVEIVRLIPEMRLQ